MKRQLLTSTLAASTLALAAFSQANSAHALSFSDNNVTVNSRDLNQSFLVNFGGSISGLSSQARFTLTDFTTTQAKFSLNLTNTSTRTSTLSGLGFDTSPTANNSSSVGGAFSAISVSNSGINFPNGSKVEVCLADNTLGYCGGGGGNGAGNSTLTLRFNGSNPLKDGLTLNNFRIRYDNIRGQDEDVSVTGSGTPTAIPTPALLPAVLGMGTAVLRKKRQEAKVTQKA